ncbi:GNAT family N-acetyltransferase [Saccharothrix variisporea]|uniref:Putative N-acetyltransferase YhbS n=1 Tax=Saccharothrix variisporea TaxID=543527 RepID=A0A495X6A6_9PSEU|nr:GNAT family N-acetyltransferase [Saccharothrix variisporea]RKT68665.1 putative N-acetyltransferase YhbS [Saccharothrix variisporea]
MIIRLATAEDVPAIVALLADDELGAQRETPHDLEPYRTAFAVLDASPHDELVVAEVDGEVVGTLQFRVLPGLAQRGMVRGQVEAVRVASRLRGQGLGEQLMKWVVERARDKGCSVVQLTSDRKREAAHRFYARLGFQATHEGFKLRL